MELTCCLASLKLQKTNTDMELQIHIMDNSKDARAIQNIRQVCMLFEGVVYHKTHGHCYTGADELAPSIKADYLCFASSDGYYVPGFSLTMLEVCHRLNSDLVYCDCVYDPRLHGRGIYSVLNTSPEMRWIDKTCFIVRKKLFKGFPKHPDNWCDGELVEQFVRKGYKLDKAKGVLVVHN